MTARDALVLAIDVGSASARAGLFRLDGTMMARAALPIRINRPVADHAEHSSDDIWSAACGAVREAISSAGADASTIRGLSFDATCSLVMLGQAGRPRCHRHEIPRGT